MSPLSVNEFKEILLHQELERVVKEHIFTGEPYVFLNWTEGFDSLLNHLCGALSIIHRENIKVVGSAKVGFSLNPNRFGRRFSKNSDIDIIIVDCNLFDKVWKILLNWNYPRRFRLVEGDKRWAQERMEDLYWGWFSPDKIKYRGLSFPEALKPLRDVSTLWFSAFRTLSQVSGFTGLEVSGRLYRTWDHALLYHVDGLRKILESTTSKEAY